MKNKVERWLKEVTLPHLLLVGMQNGMVTVFWKSNLVISYKTKHLLCDQAVTHLGVYSKD